MVDIYNDPQFQGTSISHIINNHNSNNGYIPSNDMRDLVGNINSQMRNQPNDNSTYNDLDSNNSIHIDEMDNIETISHKHKKEPRNKHKKKPNKNKNKKINVVTKKIYLNDNVKQMILIFILYCLLSNSYIKKIS